MTKKASRKTGQIDETLRKLAAATPNGTKKDPAIEPEMPARLQGLAGDPDCPYCHGLGYLRHDLPIDHPEFGRLTICTCRQGEIMHHIHQRLFAISNIDKLAHLTFENFQPRGRIGLGPWQADSLERANNQAFQFAQKLEGWLLLQGGYGCGKTHLAAAIANFTVGLGVPTLFITVPDLLDALRFAFDDPQSTFEKRFEEIRDAPLLIMDDFGTHNATPWAQEKLFQIINHRYINRLPTVVTSNVLLEQIEGRIRSRLEDPELVTRAFIQAPDFRRPADDTGHSDLSSLAAHHEHTFSRWDDRRGEGLPEEDLQSLEKAVHQAAEFAREPHGWLVFSGPYGCGKTHLAAAIANTRADMGQPPLFIGASDLLDHLRATFSPGSQVTLDRRFEEIRSAPMLILDGLGEESPTAWANEKLFQLMDFRYLNKLPTVITTARQIDDLQPRLASRLLDTRLTTICGIDAPAYRGAPAMARRKTASRKSRLKT